jgi:hypothetical protein
MRGRSAPSPLRKHALREVHDAHMRLSGARSHSCHPTAVIGSSLFMYMLSAVVP